MGLDFGGWVLVFLFIFLVMAIPATFLIIRKLTEASSVSDTVVVSQSGRRSGGRVFGNLISKEVGKHGRLHITFASRDSFKPEIHTVIVEPNKILIHPKGTRSAEKAIMEILAEDAQDFISNNLTDIETKNAETNIISAQRIGLSRQQAHLDDIGEGEISSVNLGLMKDFENKLLKSSGKEDGRSNPRNYPSGGDRFTN
jgi:hypothetical protein